MDQVTKLLAWCMTSNYCMEINDNPLPFLPGHKLIDCLIKGKEKQVIIKTQNNTFAGEKKIKKKFKIPSKCQIEC